MTIAVTGGAGYIGSHMVRLLRSRKLPHVIIDDFSTGHRDCVPGDVPLLAADVADRDRVLPFLRAHRVRAIIHFAARALVGESMRDPRLYWRHNTVATIALLDAALDASVSRFIFSSTCAVYGNPRRVPISEDEMPSPINPYGDSKLSIERVLASYARAYDLRYASLRYFNAAGAEPENNLGERHAIESHLIPLVLEAALGLRREVTIFGTDYPTADGTCIRDYIHVSDLAEAHLSALDWLDGGGESGAFNLGTGQGCSVRQVIEMARSVSGRPILAVEGPRRHGDPPELVASAARARQLLSWSATRSSLDTIVRDAWLWHSARAKS